MFVIDATADFEDALRRLARLMHNIERGERVFEWVAGSPAAARAPPRGARAFLTIDVPGVTAAAPPVAVSLRPAVGFVYYVPGAGGPGARGLATRLAALLGELPGGHLRGRHPVEVSPHATLTARGDVAGPCAVEPDARFAAEDDEWHLGPHPARAVDFDAGGSRASSHISRGAFTWHLLPVGAAMRVRSVKSIRDFNAVVAAVVFDAFRGNGGAPEDPEPFYRITPEFFGVAPPPEEVARALDNCALVLRAGRLFVVGALGAAVLGDWVPGAAGAAPAAPLNIANSPEGPLAADCGLCRVPLYGAVGVLPAGPTTAPYRVAVCEWCLGCFSPAARAKAAAAVFPRTAAEAFRGTRYEVLVPLVGARAESIGPPGSLCFRVDPAGGAAPFAVASPATLEPHHKNVPLCLSDGAYGGHRIPTVRCGVLARVP